MVGDSVRHPSDAVKPSEVPRRELFTTWDDAANKTFAIATQRESGAFSSPEVNQMLTGFSLAGVATKSETARLHLAQGETKSDLSKLLTGEDAKSPQSIGEIAQRLKDPANRVDNPTLASLMKPEDRALVIGDTHSIGDIKTYFSENLPGLKAAGVTVYGTEFLPRQMQADVDRYADLVRNPNRAKDGTELNQLRAEIAGAYDDKRLPGSKGETPLTDVLDAAVKAGMRVICMEPNIDHPFRNGAGYSLIVDGIKDLGLDQNSAFHTFTNKESSPSAQKSAAESLRRDLSKTWSQDRIDNFLKTTGQARDESLNFSPFTVSKFDDDALNNFKSQRADMRNASMANTVSDAIASGGKAVLFTGGGHFGSSTPGKLGNDTDAAHVNKKTVNELLAKKALPSTVVQFVTRVVAENGDPLRGERINSVNDGARMIGLEHKQFAFKTDGSAQEDYIIHLAQ